MSKTYRQLDEAEYAEKLLTTPLRPFKTDAEYRRSMSDFMQSLADTRKQLGIWGSVKASGGVAFDSIGDFTRLFGMPIEKVLLTMEDMSKHRLGEFYAQDWGGQEWNSDAGKAFRYDNSILMRPIGSFLRGAKQSMMRGDALEKEYPETFGEGKTLGRGKFWASTVNPGDSPIAHILRGAAYAKLEMDNNFPYATKNAKDFRNGLLDDANLLWLESAAYKLYSGAKEAAHVKGMVPTVERMINAAKAKDGDAFQAAAQSLYGRDVFGTSFRQGWMGVVANGMHDAEELATKLFINGWRSPHAAPGFQDFDLRQVPKFFKRGGEVASGGTLDTVLKFFERGGSSPMGQYDDLAYTFMKKGQKLSDFFRDVVNEAGVVGSQKSADEVLYLLRTVRRSAPTGFKDGVWDTTGTLASFEHNYREGVRSGALQEVSDEAFQYARKTIEDTTQGYKSDIGWNALLNPSKKFAASDEIFTEPKPDDLKRFWANPKGEDANSITPERLATWRAKYRTHEQIYDETNGLFSEAREYQNNIKGSIKAANDRIARAQAIMSGKAPTADIEALRDAVDVHAKAADALEARRLTEKAPASLKGAFTKMENALALSRRERGLGNSKLVDEAVANFDKQLATHDAKSAASYFESKQLAAMPASRKKLSAAVDKFDKQYDSIIRSEMLGAHDLAAGGPRAILEAKVGVRSMERQIKGIDDMVVRFKQMRTTPDYLAELKKAEPVAVGRLIGAFGSVMGRIRTLQLGNPGTAALNVIDTNGIKNMIFGGVVSGDDIIHAAKQNQLAPRYGLLGEDLNDHFTSDVARYAFDKVEDSGVFGQLREFTNKWENSGRATLGRVTYEKIAGKLVDLGMDVETASKTALTEAVRLVDKVHVDYANLSPFEKVLRGTVNLYPRFNVNDFNNAAEYAVKNGPEAYALTRLRQDQQDGSLEGTGVQFAGGDAMWGGLIGDPVSGMSPVKSMESAVMLGRALLGQERAAFVPLRILQARYGTANPAADSAAQALGLSPVKDKGALNKFDSMLSSAMAAVGREYGWDINFSPSDPILKGFGLNPGTARDKQWAMGGKFEQAVALREGRILETGDAIQQAQMKTAGRALLSILSPVSARVGNKTDADVMSSIRRVNEEIDAAAPEDQQFVKDALLSRPENKGLASFIKRTPDEIYRTAQSDEAMGPIMEGGLAAVQNQASANARLGRAAGGAYDLATNAAHMIAGGQPSAPKPAAPPPGDDGETYQWPVRREDGTDYPVASDLTVLPGESVDQAVTGKFYGKQSTRQELARIGTMPEVGASMNAQSGYVRIVLDPQNILEGKDSSQLLNYELKPRLNGARSGEEALAIINSYGEDSGALGRMVVAASKVDGSFWRPVYENILGARAVAVGLSEGGFGEAIPGAMGSTRRALQDWYSQRISRAGAGASGVANWTIDQARTALLDDIQNGRAPVGIDFTRGKADVDYVLSPTNFSLMHQGIRPGSVEASERNAEAQTMRDYPEFGKFVGKLEEASRPGYAQSERLRSAIEFGAEGMANNTIPPNVYEILRAGDKHKNLYDRVERAAMVPQTDAVWDHITLKRDGKVTGVDRVALVEMARDPKWRPALQQLASGEAGEHQARAIETALDDADPAIAPTIRSLIAVDLNQLPAHRSDALDSMTGQSHPDFSSFLSGFLPAKEQSAPGVPSATLPSRTAPIDFSGGVGRTIGSPVDASLQPSPVGIPKIKGETQFNIGYSGPGTSSIVSPAAFVSTSWNRYSEAHAEWSRLPPHQQDFKVEPTFGSSISKTWHGMANPDGSVSQAQVRVGAAGVSTAWQVAQMSTTLAGEEVPPEVNGVMTGLTTGFQTMMMFGGPNPVGIAAGVVVGTMSGILASQGGGRSGGNAESARINQERLNLQREQFNEQMRQASVRDIRTREQDLARSFGSLNQQQRTQVQSQLAAFQRRPTFQSRIGLVDAAERAVGSAIKPRW